MLIHQDMKSLTKITVVLGLLTLGTACKSDAEKRAERIDDQRDRVAEKQENLAEQQEDVAEAKVELDQARREFLATVDQELTDLDNRIAIAKTSGTVDQVKLAQLRAEAGQVRSRVADARVNFGEDERTLWDRVVRDIETELDRK